MKSRAQKPARPVEEQPKTKKHPKHGLPAVMDNILKVVDKSLPKDDAPPKKK